MLYWRDRLPWLIAGGAIAVIGLGVATVFVTSSLGQSRADAPSSASSSEESTPPPDAAPQKSGKAEVYNSFVQSGGEIVLVGEGAGVAPEPGCGETKSGWEWYLSNPYPESSILQADASILSSAASSDEATGRSYFEATLAPGSPVVFEYSLDACRQVRVQIISDAPYPTLTLTDPTDATFSSADPTLPPGTTVTDMEVGMEILMTPTVAGLWTVTVALAPEARKEGSALVVVNPTPPLTTAVIAECQVTVDGDTAILDASRSYAVNGDPVEATWWDFAGDEVLPDGARVDVSDLDDGWHTVNCLVGDPSDTDSFLGVDVWIGPDRPSLAPLTESLTVDYTAWKSNDIECSVTLGPDGLDFTMADHDTNGKALMWWEWDLPFGQTSTDLAGHIDIPDGVGPEHYAVCRGETPDRTIHSSVLEIELPS